MEKDIAIEFQHVSKIYKLKRKDKNVSKEEKLQYFYALKDISFKIKKGQVVGILGTNGSGKSTLAVTLAGIAEPNEGQMLVNGEQIKESNIDTTTTVITKENMFEPENQKVLFPFD